MMACVRCQQQTYLLAVRKIMKKEGRIFLRNFARQYHSSSTKHNKGDFFSVEWINDIEYLFKQPSTNEKSPVNLTSQRGGRQSIVLNQTRPSGSSDRKRAAVLVPLCNRHGIASIIFTLRTDTVSTHKGQVSFPGGHRDTQIQGNGNTSLESAMDCAVRETYEELGDKVGRIRIIGQCEEIPSVAGTLVTPVLGFIEEDVRDFDRFSLSHGEVKRVFSRSLQQLLDPTKSTFETYTGKTGTKFTMPVFHDAEHSNGEEERIWGLTAYILRGVLDRAIVPTQR